MAKKAVSARAATSEFREIRADYDLGRRLNDAFPERFPYGGAQTIGEHFGRPGLSRDKAEKLRALARAYSPEAFEELLARCEAGGFGLKITILTHLAAVKPRKRASVEAKMIAGKWSKSQLDEEIRGRGGRRSSGGRKPRLPNDSRQLRVSIHRKCDSWIRFGEALQASGLDESTLQRVRDACAAVRRLKRHVEPADESDATPLATKPKVASRRAEREAT